YLNSAQKLATPLQRRLNRVGQMVSLVAVVSAVAFFAIGVQQGQDFWTMMLAAVSLAVAAVPETLQLIVTLSLTHGVRQMVKRHALIRKLPAVETLGNTSIICSDKTGTLTQNRMTIQRLWVPEGGPVNADADLSEAQHRLVRYLALASNATIEKTSHGGERIIGDATESAILRLATAQGDRPDEQWPRVGEVAFSSARKMMTTVHEMPGGGYLVLTKGAFDRLPYRWDSEKVLVERRQMHDDFAHDALRVIALASRRVSTLPQDGNMTTLEHDLEFVGIIGLIDPPRPEAAEAIATARRAGVRTVMITGDHAATAGAIAKQLGLMSENGVVVTGKQLAAMDDKTLINNVRDYCVYARVSPEDKIRIVEAWQENGEVVSMTGDGVNDAPALKSADVGVAMGMAGTEVAKSAADIVLTNDNFATIVAAIREGRTVFGNIRKTIDFLLVCNLSEIVIMLGAQLMGWGIPLTPVMLLLINVLGDGIPGLHLAKEHGDEHMMTRKPIGRDESFFGDGLLKNITHQTIAFAVVGLAAYYIGAFVTLGGVTPTALAGQTMVFLVVGLTSIIRIFTVRTRKSIFKRTVSDNLPLTWSAVIMIVVFALMVLVGPVGAIFGLVPIGALNWLIVIGLTLVPTIVAELFKLWDHHCEQHDFGRRLVHHEPSTEGVYV
ncbi:MAG: cation-translocating P-type ATPase, partial [Propionibacteriaceae bacterium]|nr:cation-translocating P-type ATPase [Propionibacteriaceae bacterium]